MGNTGQPAACDDDSLLSFFRVIAGGSVPETSRRLDSTPALASWPLSIGASRQDPATYFLADIRHYVYAGDTALHVAAAAHRGALATLLLAGGADVRARNRRGAEPLHYAANGGPAADESKQLAQAEVIACLVMAGADPDSKDRSGVAPLHRAVRNRSSAAVAALIRHGADPRIQNKRGSTPLHLAVQNTGKSNSGSEAAKTEQRLIISLLLAHGGRPTDVDMSGKTVNQAASSRWILELLAEE